MSVLVLGSNSFSGASFINYVLTNTNEKIYAISRSIEYEKELLAYKNNPNYKNIEFHQLDVNLDTKKIVALIEENRVEYIVNFAAQGMVAQSWDNPLHWYNTNVVALGNLLDGIYKFDFIKKFVQISTPEVYGADVDIKESMNFAPSSPYAVSKASADLLLYSYYKTHAFPVNYTRASNVYGAYQQLYRIIPKTILAIKSGSKLPLHGGGKAIRNFIHINDVAKKTYNILQNAKSGEIYHLSNNKSISIYDLVHMICEELSVDMEKYVDITDDRVGQDSIYQMNSDKYNNDFSKDEQINLRDGIREVIDWIQRDYGVLKTHPDYYIHKK